DIPWNGKVVSGNLHLCPGKTQAPCVFYIAGCDQNKENWPHPLYNQAHQRGMHAFSFDGPGQGESNLRDIPLTADNYEQAASAAIDYLIQRPEIDPNQIVVYGISFGSFWAMRVASYEHRIRAVAGPNASYCDKYFIMNEESPRWKQLFGYLTRSTTEEELDRLVDGLTMDGYMAKIECPALLVAGEYDPRSPIEEVYRLFDQLKAPAELWVYADQHHNPSVGGEGGVTWEAPVHGVMCDWLKDRLAGKALAHPGQVVYVEPSSPGPYSAGVALKRRWYEG
ncbi:MAG: alpha/beta hydrolase family protein, partial [Chloroflexota bacterium]